MSSTTNPKGKERDMNRQSLRKVNEAVNIPLSTRTIVRQLAILFFVMTITTLSFASLSCAQDQDKASTLSPKQKSIATIAAFTANGDQGKLKTALSEGLDTGLTVNEVNEVLVHVYAYAGFPRSFNGMLTFMSVMDERQSKGIEDEMGKEASPVPANLNRDEYGAKVRAQLSGLDEVPPPAKWQKFSPVIDKFLKEHLFADLFARDILSFQDRELATVSVLASIPGLEGPLRYHLGAAMNVGLAEEQMKDFVSVIKARVGNKEADSVGQLLEEVLATRTEK